MLLTIKGLLTRGRPIANAEERNQHESNSNSHNPPSIPSAATAISTLQSDKCVSKDSAKFRFASIPPEVVLGGISNQSPPPPPLPSWGNKNTPKTTTKKKYRISMRYFLKSDDYDHDNDNEEEEEERGSVIWVQRIVPSPPPLLPLPTELPIYEMNMSAKYQLARRPAVRRRSNSLLGLQPHPLPSLINPGHRALELLGQLSSDGGSTDNTDQNDVDSGRMRRRSSSRERDLSGLPPLECQKTKTTTTMQDSSFGREPEAVDPRPPLVDTTATSTSFAPSLSPFPCMAAASSSSSSGEHDEDDDEKLMDTILDTNIEESSPQQQQQQTAEPQVYIRLWKDVIVRQEKKDAARIFGSSSCGKRVPGVAAGMGNRG